MRKVKEAFNDPRTQDAARRAAAVLRQGAMAGGRAARDVGRIAVRQAGQRIEARVARSRTPREVSPFEDEPATMFTRDDDGEVIAIMRPKVLTPGRAKTADRLAPLTSLFAFALSVWVLSGTHNAHGLLWTAAVVAPWFLAPLFKRLWRHRLRRESILLFTPSRLIVRNGRGTPEIHDRENPHRFRLESRHAAAEREAEEHEIAIERARMRGRVFRPPKYQRDTFHLVIEHEKYPRPLMEIMGREDAVRVLGRINQIEAQMERIAAMGAIPLGGPEGEWDDMPGKIPEKV